MPVSAAARSLALRCEPRVNELARRMAREQFEKLPGYDRLPDDVKDLEIAATARHGIRLFLRGVGDPQGTSGTLHLFRERAAQRAEEGLPLHLLLRTHSLGMYVLWQALREASEPGEEAALIELVDVLLASHHRIVGGVAEAYVDERSALEADARARRSSLVRGFLDGVILPGHVLLDELGLDGGAAVFALDLSEDDPRHGEAPSQQAATPATTANIGPPGDAGHVGHVGHVGHAGDAGRTEHARDAARAGSVGERRRGRRLQRALDQAFGTDVWALFDGRTARGVVPAACEPPEDLALRLSRAAGTPVRVAITSAEGPDDVPEAARTAREILRVARACGLAPGLHHMEDVLLEFHLSRPSRGSDRIAALLDPLVGRPGLVDTLRVHLARQQDRRATAAALDLHPNTVDNRLARIRQLTGIDLASPRGTALAIAALLLRDAASSASSEAVVRTRSGLEGPAVRP